VPSERVVVFSRKNNIHISRVLCITESGSSTVEMSQYRAQFCVRKVLNSSNKSHEWTLERARLQENSLYKMSRTYRRWPYDRTCTILHVSISMRARARTTWCAFERRTITPLQVPVAIGEKYVRPRRLWEQERLCTTIVGQFRGSARLPQRLCRHVSSHHPSVRLTSVR